MAFEIAKHEFLSALVMATKAIPSRSVKPILENVLLTDADGWMIVTGSDGTVTVRTRANVSGSIGASMTVPGKLLLETVRKMPSGIFTVNATNGRMGISCQGAKMTLSFGDGSLYADANNQESATVSVPTIQFKDALDGVLYASGVDDNRRVLNGVFVEIVGNQMCVTALDGFQMAHNEFPIDAGVDWNGIVPFSSAKLLSGVLDQANPETILMLGRNHMGINQGGTDVQTTMINGPYIDYRMVTPSFKNAKPCGFVAEREELLDAVERAKLVARLDGRNPIRIESDDDGILTIRASAQNAESVEKLSVTRIGMPMVSSFNPDYVSAALRSMGTDTVMYRQESDKSPALLESDVAGEYRIILPVRASA